MEIQKNIKINHNVEDLFNKSYENTDVRFGIATIQPGERLPKEGLTSHEENEFSYIMKGTLNGESGGIPYSIQAGEASIIPAGEQHWCVNEGDAPVQLVYALIK
ncbi:cupin domain-containing protein [Lysinibacillus fusiformis]|nr:cupin domain-containing protein [Lysinibacillus fusiformis]